MIRSLATLAAAFLALMGIATSGAQAQSVGIASSNPGSIYHTSASAVAKVVSDHAGIQATVQPFASPTIYLPAINAGEYEFGLTNIEELRVAVTGDRWQEGKKHEDLRAVTIIYPLRTAFFVKKDSPIKTIADFKGKRIVAGYNSQKTIPPLIDAFYAAAGISSADVIPVQVANVVAGGDAFIKGQADAFFFALGAPKVREANASVGGIRAIGLDNTPEALAAVQKHFPPAYFRPEKPSKRNPGVTEPIFVVAYDAVVVASTHTPEDVVYRLVKAMHENKKAMAEIFPVFNLFNPKRMASNTPSIQWHPGTIKFLKEQNMWPVQ